MRDEILRALRDIEEERRVRVLFAIESGSRAWGFASPDSDYDVRFVYAHELDWYLSVVPGTDHVERMLPLDLDVAGWELRKALGLFGSSNASLMEHIGSPLVYHDEGGVLAELHALVPQFFNPIAAGHHYLGRARRVRDTYLVGEHVNLKKLFYVLRPLGCLRWIELHASMPPTAFAAVLAGIDLSDEQRGWIAALTEQKSMVSEKHGEPLPAHLRAWIDGWFERSEAAVAGLPNRHGDRTLLDGVLARVVRGGMR
jgi:uncharacterized protein